MHAVNDSFAQIFIGLGGILLLGTLTDCIGKRSPLPRVTLLLILGIVVGEQGVGLIPPLLTDNFEWVATSALLVVGFLLGGQFDLETLGQSRKELFWISSCGALFTLLCVVAGLWLSTLSLPLILILACIASATAPAPIIDIVVENNDKSAFSRLLLRIVAIDDVWALVLFSVGLAALSVHLDNGNGSTELLRASYQIVGAMLLGISIGVPAAHLTGRITPGQPSLVEALGLVLGCGGIAIWLDVSYLIAVMTMGAVIVNVARHHEYAFHEIENIEWPFMVVFFVLAGASLEFDSIGQISVIGAIYILCRALGKICGAWIGATLCRAPMEVRRWIGMAMLPQAGVEIGMALMAASQFPEYRQLILSLVITATIFFEIIGPPLTQFAIKRATNPPS